MLRTLFICIIALFIGVSADAQIKTATDKAWDYAKEAAYMMKDGKVDEAIGLLEEAHKLASDVYDFEYQLAHAYYMKQDYKKALEIMKRVVKYKGIDDQVYQLLGNLYSMNGDSVMATKTYEDGLKAFPNSGRLYSEQGNVYYDKKEYSKALSYYEKGISVDPMFPSNYFRAAILFLSTEEEVWGMMYGELFILLEPNTDRTTMISKMLYDTYKSEITWDSDSSLSVSFSKNSVVNADEDSVRLPFPVGYYEPAIGVAASLTGKVDLEGMCKIRAMMLDQFYQKGFDKKYDNVLFDYQKKVKDAGLLDIYNHWVLLGGDKDEFGDWYDTHKDDITKFAGWFNDHKLEITKDNVFLRDKYD